MLAISKVAAVAIGEMLATRRMPREAGVRLTTGVERFGDGMRGPAVVMDLALGPQEGDAVLTQAPVFVEAEAVEALEEKLLDADVSSERVRFTLHNRIPIADPEPISACL
ncbi:MAG TPA: hypothetical protein VGI17_09745 [Solirubrobacterales bacterium]|jgi:hypothetical protein